MHKVAYLLAFLLTLTCCNPFTPPEVGECYYIPTRVPRSAIDKRLVMYVKDVKDGYVRYSFYQFRADGVSSDLVDTVLKFNSIYTKVACEE